MDPILVKLMESGPVTFLLASAAGVGKTPLATLPATVLATARDADADLLTILPLAWSASSTSARWRASPPGKLRW